VRHVRGALTEVLETGMDLQHLLSVLEAGDEQDLAARQ
jgi:hypothetical protein